MSQVNHIAHLALLAAQASEYSYKGSRKALASKVVVSVATTLGTDAQTVREGLAQAHIKGLLVLGQADMPQTLPKGEMYASEVEACGQSWHFVRF